MIGKRMAILPAVMAGVLGITAGDTRAQCYQQLWAPDGATDDMYGAGLAAHGEVTVVDARLHDGDAGAVYVYRKTGGLWVLEAELQATDRQYRDLYGKGVAVFGDLIAVGAPGADPAGIAEAGAVYLYRFDGAQWQYEAKLWPADVQSGDNFGFGLDVGPDLVAVGAIRSDAVGSDSGAVYLYRRIGGTWVEEARLLPSVGADLQAFGMGVDLLGDRLFVGAPQHYQTHSGTGAAYVFRDQGGNWAEEAVLLASDGQVGDDFGYGLCADAERLVVGARADDGWRGSCYLFRWDGATWQEESKVLPGDSGGWFGMAVGLRDDLLVAGAIFGGASGATYLFRWDGATWQREAKLQHSDLPGGSRFGHSVAVQDGYFAVGAPMRGSSDIGVGPGTAYLYGTCDWSWENYGDGWPGTHGIPDLTADTSLPPYLSVHIGNSFGPPTVGFLIWGLSKADLQTPWDGVICASMDAPVIPYLLPIGGLTLWTEMPALPVEELFLQALELDLGASCGVAFTPGLHLRF